MPRRPETGDAQLDKQLLKIRLYPRSKGVTQWHVQPGDGVREVTFAHNPIERVAVARPLEKRLFEAKVHMTIWEADLCQREEIPVL